MELDTHQKIFVWFSGEIIEFELAELDYDIQGAETLPEFLKRRIAETTGEQEFGWCFTD